MNSEFFVRSLVETSSPDGVQSYNRALRLVQEASIAQNESQAGRYGSMTQMLKAPFYIQDRLDPGDVGTRAAMLMGSVAQNAYVYAESGEKPPQSFSKIWETTSLAALAVECEQAVSEIQPTFRGNFVTIDKTAYKDHFINSIGVLPEHIVLSGPNGAGKTVLGKILIEFVEKCSIHSEIIKFPRPDGPLAKMILPILQGNVDLDPAALQLLFLSDVLDFKPKADTLIIFDRFPPFDALVYGPKGPLQETIFSARGILDSIAWTFIINRHPFDSQQAVAARKSKPRIFERDIEDMSTQLMAFAGLTNLPGTYWINNYDFSSTLRRLIGGVISSGVIQRRMVKQKFVTDMNEAQTKVRDVFLDNIDEWEKQLAF